jgi:hypothetical protein
MSLYLNEQQVYLKVFRSLKERRMGRHPGNRYIVNAQIEHITSPEAVARGGKFGSPTLFQCADDLVHDRSSNFWGMPREPCGDLGSEDLDVILALRLYQVHMIRRTHSKVYIRCNRFAVEVVHDHSLPRFLVNSSKANCDE